jgi:rhodanese-related sulfurtransferase
VETIGAQRLSNPALTTSQEVFVADLLAGFGPVPKYYAHMAPLNLRAAGAQPVREPVRVTCDEIAATAASGAWVIDCRSRRSYADSHLSGTVNVEYGNQFATYVGWLAPWGGRHVLVVDDPAHLEAAARDLAGIGIEDLRGMVLPPGTALPRPVGYRRTDWAGFLEERGPRVVLDVRQRDEYDDGHLPDAVHIPIQDVETRLEEIPPGEVWVHCRSGYRAGIAASLLHRAGRDVVHVDDDWARAVDLGLDRASAA